MSYAPCKNPNCKSYGQPHPNCRCYGEMAEGGDASFCSESREHNAECQYFQDGGVAGDVPENDLPGAHDKDVPANDMPVVDVPESDMPKQVSSPEPELPKEKTEGSWTDFFTKPLLDKGNPNLSAKEIASKMDPGLELPSPSDLLSGAEHFAKGLAGPLVTGAELGLSKLGVPGMSAEDQKARDKAATPADAAYEVAGSLYSPVAWMKGAGFIANGLKCMATQGMDEASKMMLGEGDPEHGAAAALLNVGATGLLCGVMGGAGDWLGKAMKPNSEALVGQRLKSTLSGAAIAAEHPSTEAREMAIKALEKAPGFDAKSAKKGIDLYGGLMAKIVAGAGGYVGGYRDAYQDFEQGEDPMTIAGDLGKGLATSFGLRLGSRYLAAPIMLRLLSTGATTKIAGALDHGNNIYSGITGAIGAAGHLFGDKLPLPAQKLFNEYGSVEKRLKLADYIGEGGILQGVKQHIHDEFMPQEGFAEGGEVKKKTKEQRHAPILGDDSDSVAQAYPEQNVLMNVAKGRISNYLNTVRPQKNLSKLAFDSEPDMRDQKKKYNKALDIANCPIGVLKEVKDGTLQADHIKHLSAMYPEVHDLLKKTLTQQITKYQLAGKRPPAKIRQGLSLLMGTALSGEMTPQGIQAAQAAFAQKNQATPSSSTPQTQGSSSRTQRLSKSDQSFLTGGQALQRRGQKV